MQTASSMIWTRVVESTFKDDNRYSPRAICLKYFNISEIDKKEKRNEEEREITISYPHFKLSSV